MPELVNPLAAFRDSYGTLEGLAQDRAKRQAGNALMQGDYQGAQGALYGRGMLAEGQAVGEMQQGQEDRQGQMEAAQKAEGLRMQKAAIDTLANINEAMAAVPPEQRSEYFRTQVVPQLQGMPGVTPESVAPLLDPSYDWSDQGIAAHRALLGQEAEKLTMFNLGDGQGVVGFDASGRQRMQFTPPPDPTRGVPQGYQRRADGQGLEYIPGGPADPRAAGALAGAKRAPRVGRGGGGGTSAKLPTGFILDGH